MSKLDVVMATLLEADRARGLLLGRGLALAFTPPAEGHGCRLVISREGCQPSTREDALILEALNRGLLGQMERVVVTRPSCVPNQVVREGWGSTVFEWEWVTARQFAALDRVRKARGLAWAEERVAFMKGKAGNGDGVSAEGQLSLL